MAIEGMTGLNIVLDGDGAWPDLQGKVGTDAVIDTQVHEVCCLPGGMASGAPSVTFRINLPDGRVVLAQTSLRLFLRDPRNPQAGGLG